MTRHAWLFTASTAVVLALAIALLLMGLNLGTEEIAGRFSAR